MNEFNTYQEKSLEAFSLLIVELHLMAKLSWGYRDAIAFFLVVFITSGHKSRDGDMIERKDLLS